MSSLDVDTLASASRVFCRSVEETEHFVSTVDPADIASLAAALATDRPMGGYCLCAGTVAFEFEFRDAPPRCITLHHGTTLRWDDSPGDVHLADPDKVMDWLSAHDMSFVRREYEDARRKLDEHQRHAARWRMAMPASLRPFFSDMASAGPSIRPEWAAAIEAELPDPVVRATALLDLFGKGAGPWSGFPSWEMATGLLLAVMPLPVLFDAIGDAPGVDRLEGALRLFSGWDFRARRAELRRTLPEPLRQRLVSHAAKMALEDNRRSAMKLLGD